MAVAATVVVAVCLHDSRRLAHPELALGTKMRRRARLLKLTPAWYFAPLLGSAALLLAGTGGAASSAAICGAFIAALAPAMMANQRAAAELTAAAENLPTAG